MTLFRVRKTGGPAEVMIPGYVAGITPSPQGLVILRMNENASQGDRGRFQLLRWSGGVPTDLCEYGGLEYVAANASLVVWIDNGGIKTCPLTGGPMSPVQVLDTSDSVALAVDSTHAYWSTFVGTYRVPLVGGERETLAIHPDSTPVAPLVLDDEDILFPRQSRLLRIPKTGGNPSDAVPPQTDLMFFTVTATHIYWGEGYPIACLKRMLKLR